MAKLTFGQEAIQNIINQGRIEAGITNIIKNASDGERLDAAIVGADVLQAGVSLFKNIPVAGAAISATDLNNILYCLLSKC
jgi:hypothetical protein